MKKTKKSTSLPTLITTLGFPGSGKTHFSERLAKEKGFLHLNSDMMRFTIFEVPTFSREETQGVFRLMDKMAELILKTGTSVVYDANMNYRSHRTRTHAIAKKCGAAYLLAWIRTDVAVAEKRLEKRAKITDKKKQLMYRPIEVEVLHRLKGEIEEPSKQEAFVEIDGHEAFSKQLIALNRALSKAR